MDLTSSRGDRDRDQRDILTLGTRLASAEGFRVIAMDGRDVGAVEHVVYKRHADHPDEVVFRRKVLLWERLYVATFDDVAEVDVGRERVYLGIPSAAIRRHSD